MSLGDYIAIESQLGPFEFECSSVSTGTPFRARIDDDKHVLFEKRDWIEAHPSACRFLRPAGEGRIVCTIHDSSPIQCRLYRCVVLRIRSPDGTLIGTVHGDLALHSDDPGLREIWEGEGRRDWREGPDAEERIAQFLKRRGYRVE